MIQAAQILVRHATPLEVQSMLTRSRIIDVREPHEFFGAHGHVPGAELVPLASLEVTAAQWTRDEPLVVVCRSGTRSFRAAQLLNGLGFKHVTNLVGGMIAWRALDLPIETRLP